MRTNNEQLVTDFCNALADGLSAILPYLADDVLYHNMPWEPVTGHAGVRQVLEPFIGSQKLLQKMEIKHTTSAGNVVMNERLETWVKGDVTVLLPVLGVFTITDGKIAKWCDYFNAATVTPLTDVLAA